MSLTNKTIVVIDDTPSIRTFLRVSLEDEGMMCHEASTAKDGISLCESEKPDVVILDLGLPDMDGLEALPIIKTSEYIEKTPKVIILTVRKGRAVVNEVKEKGADAYLNKPFMVDDLLEVMERLTE